MMGLPSCREVTARLSREQDQATRGRRSLALRLHLLMCQSCRRYQRQLTWLRHSLRAALALARLSGPARARIRARLQRARDDEL